MRKYLFIFISALLLTLRATAQVVTGVITDGSDGEPLTGARVYYADDKQVAATANIDGRYTIPFRKGKDLVFYMMGYDTQIITVTEAKKLNVKLKQAGGTEMKEVEVSKSKMKYSRKNNPAVDMMRKVIAAKSQSDLRQHDFLSYNKYEKMTMALNEFTPKVFEDDHFKRFPFLKDHVEICPETGKLILPITVDEKYSRQIYRRDPKKEKTIVIGKRSEGVTDLINTGDLINTMMEDCFADIDIYKDEVRMFQYPFTSPIATSNAISFYRYFIEDTLMVGNDKCYQIDFTPNNPQDFGFSGSLYVMADSTWRVKRAKIGIPSRSDVNFVESLDITQDFAQIPSGEQVVTDSKTIVQLKLVSWLQKFQVERVAKFSNWEFTLIPEQAFKFKGDVKEESSAEMRDNEFWEELRPVPLTQSESGLNVFLKKLQDIKGVKEIIWVAKAFIENFVETSIDPKHPSKVDIGPVNTMISHNFVEGLKLRASAQTTANLSPHWFAKGYLAYGFKDHRWKGQGELIYSFNRKDYLPREFPKNNLSFQFWYDVMAPTDKFVPTDKDNVFTSLKWTPVDHMSYVQRFQLLWDREWENGLSFKAQFRRDRTEAAGELYFQRMNTFDDGGLIDRSGDLAMAPLDHEVAQQQDLEVKYMHTSEFFVGLEYQPGATWANTKQRRIKTNYDSPVWGISHATGVKGLLGGEYNYNLTELTIYKRFWLKTWGKFDLSFRADCQWNQVPFPLLPQPSASLSYIRQDYNFSLIANQEFLNDRMAQLLLTWDLNGKIFNRIPLLKKLKWREWLGCNLLWGNLSDKNNPFLQKNLGNPDLFFAPGYGTGAAYAERGSIAHTMQTKRPYCELTFGIHNIFKLFQVEYVRRINYLDWGARKWGVRFTFRATF